jgi:hypothetical protein
VIFALLALAADPVGRIDSYVRSNSDGSEREAVHVYRAAPDRIEVIKTRARCTSAAFVSAALSPDRQYAMALTGGRLLPDAKHSEMAWLSYGPLTKRISVRIDPPGGKSMTGSLVLQHHPWHDYEFDLASLSAAIEALPEPRRGFSFGLTMLAPEMPSLMKELGRADFRFVRAERRDGRRVLRFQASGPAFGTARGGPIWIDAGDHHIVEARFGLPNHDGYTDFVLRQTGTARGASAWERLQRVHFEGCPTPPGRK